MHRNDNAKLRKSIHLKKFDYKDSYHVYFLTLCTSNKVPVFSDDRVANVIVKELEFRRGTNEIRLFCYCIMPDHLHLLISLTEVYSKSLQNWISTFKRHTSRVTKKIIYNQSLWHKNFYDHVVRKEESLVKIGQYILNNPVRKGFVMEWKEYPYSRMVDPFPV